MELLDVFTNEYDADVLIPHVEQLLSIKRYPSYEYYAEHEISLFTDEKKLNKIQKKIITIFAKKTYYLATANVLICSKDVVERFNELVYRDRYINSIVPYNKVLYSVSFNDDFISDYILYNKEINRNYFEDEFLKSYLDNAK